MGFTALARTGDRLSPPPYDCARELLRPDEAWLPVIDSILAVQVDVIRSGAEIPSGAHVQALRSGSPDR